jgi:hypothetical protein
VIDAHNEYGQCFGDRAFVAGPGNLKLPFWLFNFEEIVEIVFGSHTHAEREIGLLADLIALAKTEYAKSEYARSKTASRSGYRPSQADVGRYTADTPVPYRMEDLIAYAESRMGKLENGDVAVVYQRLIMRLNAARKRTRATASSSAIPSAPKTRWSTFSVSSCVSPTTSGPWRSSNSPASRPRRWKSSSRCCSGWRSSSASGATVSVRS